MSQQPMNKTGGEEGSLATGVDTGGIAPGGTVHSAAKENPQAEEGRSFVNNQSAAAGGQDEDRIDTDGDGRTRARPALIARTRSEGPALRRPLFYARWVASRSHAECGDGVPIIAFACS